VVAIKGLRADADIPSMSLGRGAAAPAVALGVWMHRAAWRFSGAAFAAGFGLFCVWGGAYALLSDHATTGNAIGLAVVFAALASVSALFAARILSAGLLISSDGVLMRGVLKTHRFSPHEVTGFAPGTRGSAVPLLSHPHGRPIGVFALSRTGLLKSSAPAHARDLQPLCDELNQLLSAAQAAAPTTDPVAPSPLGSMPPVGDRTGRVFVLSIAGVFAICAAGVAALLPTAPVIGLMTGLVALELVLTTLILRSATQHARQETSATTHPNS
jgi:hypothetical protein